MFILSSLLVHHPRRLACAATAALGLALAAPAAHAQLVGFVTSGGSRLYSGQNNSFGYAFTLSAPLTATRLGTLDYGADGLLGAVSVTLWNSTGTALAHVTVPAGTGTEVNSYLYAALTVPLPLLAGDYVLSQTTSNANDSYVAGNSTTITPAAGITYNGSRSVYGQKDTFPATDAAINNNGYFGPNIQFAAVPEPSTWAAVAAGVGGLGATLRRRRRRAARA